MHLWHGSPMRIRFGVFVGSPFAVGRGEGRRAGGKVSTGSGGVGGEQGKELCSRWPHQPVVLWEGSEEAVMQQIVEGALVPDLHKCRQNVRGS